LSAAANYLLALAITKAQQNYGRPIWAAVRDAPGFLVAFARMEGVRVRTSGAERNR